MQTELLKEVEDKLNRALYTIIDLYFKDNGDHFTVYFISERAIACAKDKIAFEPHLYTKGKNIYLNSENDLLSQFIAWAMTNDLKFDRGEFELPGDQDETFDDEHRYTIGSTISWKGKDCIITNRFRNGILVISPKGNGNDPAKYYSVKEHDVRLK